MSPGDLVTTVGDVVELWLERAGPGNSVVAGLSWDRSAVVLAVVPPVRGKLHVVLLVPGPDGSAFVGWADHAQLRVNVGRRVGYTAA